jgi:hypothetical protein
MEFPPVFVELAERETLAMVRIADALEALVEILTNRPQGELLGDPQNSPMGHSNYDMDEFDEEDALSSVAPEHRARVKELIHLSKTMDMPWSTEGGRWFFDNHVIDEYQRRHLPT